MTDEGERPGRREDRGVRYAAYALATWTALTAVAFLLEVGRGEAVVHDAAEIEAQLSYQILRIARRWNAGHGGVFVPVTETVRPSPYLAHMPDREARTAGGRELTLMNPAWMTREILELTNEERGLMGHITSLRPLRPENAPDPWERGALERIEAGASSFSELVDVGGEERLRFMGRLTVEESCLRCHGAQGYREGDVRGGIAVSVPVAPLEALGARDNLRQALVHGSIWLLGVLGILIALADHRRRAFGEAAAERRKQAAEAELAAARRLEAVGRLSAGLAHDLNNLLAPILTVSGVVKDELPPASPLREDLDEIRNAARKARDLIRSLQTLSRKNGARLERIHVAGVASEGAELLRGFAGTRLGFALVVEEGTPTVLADRPLLELALANLVVNAREGAVSGREVRMSVGAVDVSPADAGRFQIRSGRHAAVTVAGAGVAPSLLDGIGGFSTVQGAADADPGGAGFGLPTINGIAAQYGGGVLVREDASAGWIVRLLLPAAPSEAAQES
jgi:signal transduction histidine kinase